MGNGQAPGITTGRGAAGAAAGLRFAAACFARRRAGFFLAAAFLPARLFALAIRTSSRLPRAAAPVPQWRAAWVLVARSR
jgi:hypothetical protein